ncbi:hypothetical protein BD560DRAFT_466823 [Blakeslea trispora]|nr:hypothetical protein BD560DRAFT_466823 [Blakeslea trispora]
MLDRIKLYGTNQDHFNVSQNENIGEVFDETYKYQHPPNLFENADEQPVGGEVFEEFPEIDKSRPDPFSPDERKARNDTTHAPKPYQEPPAQKVDWSKAKIPANLQIAERSSGMPYQGLKIKGRSQNTIKQKQKGFQIVKKPEHVVENMPDQEKFPDRYIETLTEHLNLYIHHNQQREIHQDKATKALSTLTKYLINLCHQAFHSQQPRTTSEHKAYCIFRADKIKAITKYRRAQYEHIKRRTIQEDPWSSFRPKDK